eukprot:TRINITY_DN3505_c2_g1_i3.p1 TRINITY_DN3505_c2_g1~~TRINITY_DN3505_c2_g1_i3.p1  ORF type:complete len:867 (+),score=220.21 TRINITY_DN3505_c2_g1_i3:235-2835(+)
MKIQVGTLKQDKYTLDVDPNWTVARVKKLFCEKVEEAGHHFIRGTEPTLMFRGKVLDDHDSLRYYHIQESDSLVVLLRVKKYDSEEETFQLSKKESKKELSSSASATTSSSSSSSSSSLSSSSTSTPKAAEKPISKSTHGRSQIVKKSEKEKKEETKVKQEEKELKEDLLKQLEEYHARGEQAIELKTQTFYSVIIEAAKVLITKSTRMISLLIDHSYDELQSEHSTAKTEAYTIVDLLEQTTKMLEQQLNVNVHVLSFDERVFQSIEEKGNELFQSVWTLITDQKLYLSGSVSSSPSGLLSNIRKQSRTVAQNIRNLIAELEREKLTGESNLDIEESEAINLAEKKAMKDVLVIPTELRKKLFRPSFTPSRTLDSYQPEKIMILQKFLKKVSRRSLWRNIVSDYNKSPPGKSSCNRCRILFEFLSTETHYVEGLELIIHFWLRPLRERSKTKSSLATPQQINDLFGSIEVIYNINYQMLGKFRDRLDQFPTVTNFGDIMFEMAPMLKLYVDYVNNYDTSVKVYKELCKNKDFSDWNSEVQQKTGRGLDLSSLLITPIQRVPRYELLLQQLLKHTTEYHADYKNLVNAKDRIQQTNKYINVKKQEQDNRIKLFELQESIVSSNNTPMVVVAPHRLYVMDGLLDFTNRGRFEHGRVYVMNDMIILTRMIPEIKPRTAVPFGIPLIGLVKAYTQWSQQQIEEAPSKAGKKTGNLYLDTIKFKNLQVSDCGPIQFSLIQGDTQWDFFCDTKKSKKDWVSTIHSAVETYTLYSLIEGISDSNTESDFLIVSGSYGNIMNKKVVDVTDILNNKVREQGGNQLKLESGSKVPLFGDPTKKKDKQLLILYSAKGNVQSQLYKDEDPVFLNSDS